MNVKKSFKLTETVAIFSGKHSSIDPISDRVTSMTSNVLAEAIAPDNYDKEVITIDKDEVFQFISRYAERNNVFIMHIFYSPKFDN